MKKTIFIIFIFILFSLCVSCGDTGDGPNPVPLDAPTLTLTNDTVTWIKIENATKYEVSLDGTLSYIENEVTSKKLNDGETIKIRAIGDGNDYEDSVWSNSVTYEINEFKVTWKSDNVELYSENVKVGTIPYYNGITPIKKSTEKNEYEFIGWDKELNPVNSDIVFNAVFEVKVRKYNVVWMSEGQILKSEELEYGTIPIIETKPVKESTSQYSYEFIGWDKDIKAITGDITFKAIFKESIRKFEVVWMSENTILKTEFVEFGKTPFYNGTPTKEGTAQYSYTFTGWNKNLGPITEDITYNALFKEKINQYTINFYDEDGKTLLNTITVNYGESVTYNKNNPIKNATESTIYTFNKWVTEQNGIIEDDLNNVVNNRNVYATYKSETKKVDVYAMSNNSFGTLSTNILTKVDYGTEIKVIGNKISINNNIIEATPLANNAQYTYEFVKWDVDEKVSNDTKIIAIFSRSINTYKVTWMQDNKILEIDEKVLYGETPKYNGETPSRPTYQETDYIFNGWSPVISTVTGDVIYNAQFTETVHKYQVKFYDEDGITLLGSLALPLGDKANYLNAIPTKQSTVQYEYQFEKWVNKINGDQEANLEYISSDINVYAKYSEKIRKYTVTFVDYNGKKIKEELVEYGKAATIPEDPKRENYKFNGWDNNSYLNVTENIYVYAKYVRLYEVIFKDINNSVISQQYVEAGSNAEEPHIPEIPNYIFNNWSSNFTNIQNDLIVYAEYKEILLLQYYNFDNSIFETITVSSGDKIKYPSTNPIKKGYHFIGWDIDSSIVTTDLYIYPIFEINRFNIIFTDYNGKILKYDCNGNVLKNSSIIEGGKINEPYYEKYAIDWESNKCLEFEGWFLKQGSKEYKFDTTKLSLDNITPTGDITDVILTAKYKNHVNIPVIYIDSSNYKEGDTNLNIGVYLFGNFSKLYGMNIGFNYDDSIIIKNEESVFINQLIDTDKDVNKLFTEIDHENSKYEIVWSNGEGINNKNNFIKLLDVTFTLNTNVIKSNYKIQINELSYIINEDLQKITPLIINGNIYLTE